MTPAGTSNELDVQNEWEENTHTHMHICQKNIEMHSIGLEILVYRQPRAIRYPPGEVFFCTVIPYTVKLSVFRPSVDTPRRRSCFDLAAGSFRAMTTCLFTRSSRVGTASPSLRRRKNESFLSSTAAASSASENRLNPARRSTRPCGRFTP